MKHQDLTPEDFDRLLCWLDPSREEAALKYERIRVRLLKFFVCGGCGCDAECLSDETFNRVSLRLKRGDAFETHEADKLFLFLGFAKNIRHEHLREFKFQENIRPIRGPDPDNDHYDTNIQLDCLDECIDELTTDKRWLINQYYLYEKSVKIKHRKKIAIQLNIDLKALRLRVHRIREQLRPCIENCLARTRA